LQLLRVLYLNVDRGMQTVRTFNISELILLLSDGIACM